MSDPAVSASVTESAQLVDPSVQSVGVQQATDATSGAGSGGSGGSSETTTSASSSYNYDVSVSFTLFTSENTSFHHYCY